MANCVNGIQLAKLLTDASLECREGSDIVVLKLCDLASHIHPVYLVTLGDSVLGRTLSKDLQNSSENVRKAVLLHPQENRLLTGMYTSTLGRYPNLADMKSDLTNGVVHFLWMKRALEFLVTFLEKCYVTNFRDSLKVCAQKTYDETLKCYHGFLASNLVKLAINLAPTKEVFTKRFGFQSQEEAISTIHELLKVWKPLIEDISTIIESFHCNFKDKAGAHK